MDKLAVSLDFLEFPPEHTCDGGNISPQITIEGLDSSSLAIMVFNPSMRGCPLLLYMADLGYAGPESYPRRDTPRQDHHDPISALQGTNDAGVIGYTGPSPQPGEMHRYLFRVYGLDDFLRSPGVRQRPHSFRPCTTISSSTGRRKPWHRGYRRTQVQQQVKKG